MVCAQVDFGFTTLKIAHRLWPSKPTVVPVAESPANSAERESDSASPPIVGCFSRMVLQRVWTLMPAASGFLVALLSFSRVRYCAASNRAFPISWLMILMHAQAILAQSGYGGSSPPPPIPLTLTHAEAMSCGSTYSGNTPSYANQIGNIAPDAVYQFCACSSGTHTTAHVGKHRVTSSATLTGTDIIAAKTI